jgi:transposase InsO family protein
MQQFEPFKIVHVEGRNNLCADSLSRLHLYNLMQPKTDNLSDEEARMADEGEGGDDAELMNCTYSEMVNAVNACHVHHASCNHAAFAASYGAGCAPNFVHKCNLIRGEEDGGWGRDGTKPVPFALTVAPRDPDERKLEELLRDSELLGEVIGKEHQDGGLLAKAREREVAAPDAHPSEASETSTPKKRAVDSQTCDADLRDARKRAAGAFPNRRLIEAAHDGTHPGVATTWARVQRACGMAPGERGAVSREEVRRFVEACPICQKLKPARARLERAAGTIRQRPFTQYAFDVIVLPEADVHGHRYILTVVDSFSGACELFPLKHSSADEVVQHLVDVMSRWTRPNSVRCDNAKSFASALMRKLMEAAAVQRHFVAPFAHQSNGQVENLNRRVEHVLRVMILNDKLGRASKNNWSILLPMVRGIVNSKLVHRHGCTANDLLYGATGQRLGIFEDEPWMQGCEPSIACSDVNDGAAAERAAVTVQQWREQHETLLASCERAQDDLLQRHVELQGPEAAEIDSLQPGDAVLVSVEERGAHKLSARWRGPYLVVTAPEGQRVLLQHLASKKVGEFQLSMLKRCNLDLMADVNDWLPLAAQDNFEYVVEAVLSHRPATRSTGSRKKRPKSDFSFLVRWADLPEGDENPSWEPWTNQSLRESAPYAAYLAEPSVAAALGQDFLE